MDKSRKIFKGKPCAVPGRCQPRQGKARRRPFMFAGETGEKPWLCANSTTDVYQDLRQNPDAEISVSSPSCAWIRLKGEAVSGDNMAARETCIRNPIVKGQYGGALKSIFQVFSLKNARAVIAGCIFPFGCGGRTPAMQKRRLPWKQPPL